MREDSSLIVPAPPSTWSEEASLDVWGYRDTAFTIAPSGHIILTGARYRICGIEFPCLREWMSSVLDVTVSFEDAHESHYPCAIPSPIEHTQFLSSLRDILQADAISSDPLLRLRRGHGHSLAEMYAIKYAALDRVPDLVVFPSNSEQVAALVMAARKHDVCLVPYGGGTNVSDALLCDPHERRMIVSVDMQRLGQILWIDPGNRMACIQAGAVGRHIQSELARYGYTMGHEPDSVEFSTLGGWIATRASGMAKNRYGNIEDLVLDIQLITPEGDLVHAGALPRESIGIDPRQCVFGSEGRLGLITSAVVKISPLPGLKEFDSWVFSSFADGFRFLQALMDAGDIPASVRLMDNSMYQFSRMFSPRARGPAAALEALTRAWATRVKRLDPSTLSACTISYEGTRRQVASQKANTRRIAKRHGGTCGGAANGRHGYDLTYCIAYFRDFVIKYYVLGDSFETSVPWTRALTLCDNVKRNVNDAYAARQLPGRPFISCRVTQVYPTGVAIYFYLAFYHKGVDDPCRVYSELERVARDTILKSGGALSHHHGVGKKRAAFLSHVMSPIGRQMSRAIKDAVDPTNVFGINNQ